MYDEKEQDEQGKIKIAHLEEERSTRKYKQIIEKSDAKWKKGSGDLRARPHPAKFPTCEKEIEKSAKEIKESLGQARWCTPLIPVPGKAEAGSSLSSRPG